MFPCPSCNSDNRIGAKFCKSCGYLLPQAPLVTVPVQASPADDRGAGADSPAQAAPQRPRGSTQPLKPGQTFSPRATGAVIGEHFMVERLIFSNDSQHRYVVKHFGDDPATRLAVCPNPVCAAVYAPQDGVLDLFCNDCGSPLVPGAPTLVAIETLSPPAAVTAEIIHRSLVHGSLRAPLFHYTESLGGIARHVIIQPYVDALPGGLEPRDFLTWAPALAYGLHYLHTNQVSFGGQITSNCFGITAGRLVWADFSTCSVHPDMVESARPADVRSLAAQIYFWLTGKTALSPETSLKGGLNGVFETALALPGFPLAQDFGDALAAALEDVSVASSFDYYSGRLTHTGMVRTLNEDAILAIEYCQAEQSVFRPAGVYVVADGMGGHTAGEVASATIVNTIAQKAFSELFSAGTGFDRQAWLSDAVQAANAAVFNLRKTAGTDMGSTMVIAALEGDQAYLGSVGDSRIYLINAGGIRQLTTDHSLVERLIATHQITREEARSHPQRNVVYRTVGDKPRVEVDTSTLTLTPGDMLLLCSDGLSGMVDDATLHQIAASYTDPQAACNALVAAANAAGGEDNVSAIIVKVTGADHV